jgi:hypothetical protein
MVEEGTNMKRFLSYLFGLSIDRGRTRTAANLPNLSKLRRPIVLATLPNSYTG